MISPTGALSPIHNQTKRLFVHKIPHLDASRVSYINCLSCALFIYSDDRLSLAEFTLICRALFRNDKGHIYIVPSDHLEQMFAVFDKNQDGKCFHV